MSTLKNLIFRNGASGGAVLVLLLATVLGQACSDESLDDFRAKKAQDDAAAMAKAQGDYTGIIYSHDSSSAALGTLEVSLQVQMVPQKSSDNLGTESSASLTGAIHFDGIGGAADASLTNANYDTNLGTFTASVPLTDAQGLPYTMQINGNVANGQLTGNVSIGGYTNYSGDFTLSTGGAPGTQAQGLTTGARAQAIDAENYIYTGTDSKGTKYQLTMNDLDSSANENFLRVFSPFAVVDVTLSMGINRYPLDTAQINYQTTPPTLNAKGTATTASGGFADQLICHQLSATPGSGWVCNFMANSSVTLVPTAASRQ
jgi:hypothetical protein